MKRISLFDRSGYSSFLIFAAAAVIFTAAPSFAGGPAAESSSGTRQAKMAGLTEKLNYFQDRSDIRAAEKAGALAVIENSSKKRIVAAIVCGTDQEKEYGKFVGHYLKKRLAALGYDAVLVKAELSGKTSRELAARWLMKKHGARTALIVDITKYSRSKKFSPFGACVDAAFFGFTNKAEVILSVKFYTLNKKKAVYERVAWAVKRNSVLAAFHHPEGILSRCAGAAVDNLLDAEARKHFPEIKKSVL